MITRVLLLLLAALVPCSAFAAALEVVAQFERPGTEPMSRLLYVAATSSYYGTTNSGGTYDLGTVFKLASNGTRTTLVSFSGTGGPARGSAPGGGLVLGADGALYGTTTGGGAGDYGTIFRITTAGAFSTLIEFTGTTGAAKGAVPNELIFSNSALYGTTQAGGASDNGTFFRLGPGLLGLLDSFTTLAEFTGTSGALKGTMPAGALVAGSGNNFYGVAEYGGAGDCGTIFKLNVTNVLGIYAATPTWVVDFPGSGSKGVNPGGGLVLHTDGLFYGTTQYGGSTDCGMLFRVNSNGNGFVAPYSFNDDDGASPTGALVMGSDAALYGTTMFGGDQGRGTIFRITTSGAHTTLASFTGEAGAVPGDTPCAGLIIGPTGNFVGATSAGGPGNTGTVFQLTPTAVHSVLANFTTPQGWRPAGPPAWCSNGTMYVPMAEGGTLGGGTLLRVTGGTPEVVTSFSSLLGEEPDGGLLEFNGALFGATKGGGNSSRGTLFRHDPNVGTSSLASLNLAGGSAPEGTLTAAPDGFLYGVAREGGSAGKGAILRISPSGGRTTLVSFTGVAGLAPGSRPHAPLILGADGNLYGVTEKGGVNDKGTVFKVTLDGALTTLAQFSTGGPHSPLSGLTAGADGEFYGTTAPGGAGNNGTVFKVTPAGMVTVVAEFTGASGSVRGAQPAGSLLPGVDGSLYGTTTSSGANGCGTLFRIRPGQAAETLFDFTEAGGAVPGAAPTGGLVMGPDGSLYGATEEGGAGGGGVIFRVTSLGPAVATDPCTYEGLIGTVHGRVETGGEETTAWFEMAVLPELLVLPINLQVPAQVTNVNGVLHFSAPIPNLHLGHLLYFRACAQNASGTAKGIVRETTALTPLQAWKSQHFGNPNTPDLDDGDHDGAANLTEYALLDDPTLPDPHAHAAPVLKQYAEGVRLALFLNRDPARLDVTITVEAASSAKGPWTAVATSVNGAPFSGPGYVSGDANTSGIKTVEIRDVPPPNAPARFLRVVTQH